MMDTKFTLAALAMTLASASALAQATAPAKPANTTSGDLPLLGAPSEAVQRQALGPYRMILQNANQAKAKPAAPAATPAMAAVPAPAPAAKRATAAAPVPPAPATLARATAQETKTAEAPAAPVPATAAAAAPTQAPAAVTQVALAAPSLATAAMPALAPAAQPAAVARKELIAIKQDPPVLSNAVLNEVGRGLVKLRFDVNADGSTSDVQVASSTHRKLNSAAMAAVSKWRFQPIEAKRSAEIDMSFSSD